MSNGIEFDDDGNFSLIFNQFLEAMRKFALCGNAAFEYCIVGKGKWWRGFPRGFVGTVVTIPEFGSLMVMVCASFAKLRTTNRVNTSKGRPRRMLYAGDRIT